MLEQIHCAYCSSAQQVVEVHGHRQCLNCGINLEPCCEGSPFPCFSPDIDISLKDR